MMTDIRTLTETEIARAAAHLCPVLTWDGTATLVAWGADRHALIEHHGQRTVIPKTEIVAIDTPQTRLL
jgi:hypothetical protein